MAPELLSTPVPEATDELEFLSSATLTRRKDFLDREEEAKSAPNRVLYFRRNADNDRLISACTKKLQADPHNVRALLIRASSHVKKGAWEPPAPRTEANIPHHVASHDRTDT
jgi:hypothetical protein